MAEEEKKTESAETNSSSKEDQKTADKNADTEKKKEASCESDPIVKEGGSIPGSTSQSDLLSIDASIAAETAAIIANSDEVKLRQHLLNPKKYKDELKKPNPNKMPNNEDPYPVDLKIEELEVHNPPVKVYEVKVHQHARELGRAFLYAADRTEKRLVKLENMMATLFRMVYRLGTRVPINCMYYGGQTPFEKYKGIRCLHDDRISEGQNVQIDQCLCCTRFEPVDGQMYEILSDLGANVATILDDNQAAYANMKDYINLTRVEEYNEPYKKASIDLSKVETRDESEQDFKASWGEGIKMDWHLVPKEDQKTHINWRQSINDDGSNLKRLDSFVTMVGGVNGNIGGLTSSNIVSMYSIMKKNRETMEQNKIGKGQEYISKGIAEEGKADEMVNVLKDGKQQKVAKAAAQDVDSLLPCIIGHLISAEPGAVASKLQKLMTETNTKNPAVIVPAYVYGKEFIIGDVSKKIPRLDYAETDDLSTAGKTGDTPVVDDKDIDKPESPSDNKNDKENEDNGDKKDDKDNTSGESNNNETNKPKIEHPWSDRENWLWTDVLSLMEKQVQTCNSKSSDINSGIELFTRVCYLYCAVYPKLKTSPWDSDEYAFPFTSEELAKGIYYTSPFGPRESTGSFHRGIDLGTDRGIPIHAIADGTVVSDGTNDSWSPWHTISIQHANGIYSRYMHCNTMSVKSGQTVSKGDVIGTVGSWGQNGADTYPGNHLHFEVCPGDAASKQSDTDPLTYYPEFKAKIKKGDQIPAD